MKSNLKLLFIALSIAAIGALGMALQGNVSNWLSTTGILWELAGITQLAISGFFERIFAEYSNEGKYPYGPPSHITRNIIDNPDTPVKTGIRNLLFFDNRTGAGLIIFGLLLQLVAVWS